jgi:hypothetical protein
MKRKIMREGNQILEKEFSKVCIEFFKKHKSDCPDIITTLLSMLLSVFTTAELPIEVIELIFQESINQIKEVHKSNNKEDK